MSKHEKEQQHETKEEKKVDVIDNEMEISEEEKATIDPYFDPNKPEDGDITPPQDLNLKLQIEKENSLALTKMLQQLKADFENYRKRNAKLEEESYRKGVFDAAKSLMPAFDAVENALKHTLDDETKQGIAMIEREILKSLQDLNITPITAVGKPFDHNLHNAIMSEEVEGTEPGIVLDELQKGFISPYGVVRYSLVKVSK